MTGARRHVGGRRPGALLRAARGLRWYLQEVSGENDYHRYVERYHQHGGTDLPVSRSEFERRRLEDSCKPGSRCC